MTLDGRPVYVARQDKSKVAPDTAPPPSARGRTISPPFWPFATQEEFDADQEDRRKAYAILKQCHAAWEASHAARVAARAAEAKAAGGGAFHEARAGTE